MKILRNVVLAAAVAGATAMTGTPANAAGAGVFTGVASINCFGCGVSNGSADLWVTGVVGTTPAAAVQGVTPPNAKATFSVTEIPSQCPVTGSAVGVVTGAVNVGFSWTRVGATAVITTTGDINGGGAAAFAVTSPVGNPCGGAVTAQVVGAVAGA